MLTIDDLLHTTLAPDATVVTGADHLGVDVSWAAALRSRPPAFEGLKGGELAIVSLATMHQLDDRLTLARLIEQIAGLGVAAVAVAGTVDDDARRAASRLGLPVIQIPETVSARDLEARVTRAIVERRAELQRVGQDLYHQLLEIVVAGRGVEAVVAKLAALTSRPAVLQDPALNLLAIRLPPGGSPRGDLAALVGGQRAEDIARLHAMAANASDPPTIRLPLPQDGLARIVAPIGGPHGRDGYLSVIGAPSELGAFERLAVSRAAAACAIDFARERAARSDSDLRLAEVLDELLAGSYPSEAAILGRAQRLGCDLTAPQRALALRGIDAEGAPATRALERLLRRELARRSLPAAIRLDATGALVLLPVSLTPEAVQLVVGQLRDGLAGLGGHLAAALSRPASGADGLRDALRIARRTLDYAVRTAGPDAWCLVSDLGADELLMSLGPSPLLQAFRDDWLERLAAYDRRNKTQLVQTLAVYFDAHASPTEAAERLHLHRNTLLYRLQRIREITGRDPDDPRAQLAFHLALRIDEVLRQP
ncbi:MAG: CdaR family transcriptional regulator [Dehalococcoidia bacterium]|nr:MAG: CdaR family transcriptional regulator [Dehalococcoidia bacterium]